MLERSLKLAGISLAMVCVVGCSSMSGGKSASNKVDSAEKALNSDLCKGKVNPSEFKLKTLESFLSDPTSFYCNATARVTNAVMLQYVALGETEKAAQAKQTLEKIQNGVYGPESAKALLVSLSPTEADKVRIQTAILEDKSGKMKQAYLASQSEVSAATKEVAIGTASLALQINSAVQAVKSAKEKKGDTFAQIAAVAQVAKTTADVIRTVQLAAVFRDVINQYNVNNEFINAATNAEAGKPSLEGATDLASLATF